MFRLHVTMVKKGAAFNSFPGDTDSKPTKGALNNDNNDLYFWYV